jgi:hypothetical protein
VSVARRLRSPAARFADRPTVGYFPRAVLRSGLRGRDLTPRTAPRGPSVMVGRQAIRVPLLHGLVVVDQRDAGHVGPVPPPVPEDVAAEPARGTTSTTVRAACGLSARLPAAGGDGFSRGSETAKLPRWSRSGMVYKARPDVTLTGILCARGIQLDRLRYCPAAQPPLGVVHAPRCPRRQGASRRRQAASSRGSSTVEP